MQATCKGCGGTRDPRKYLCLQCWDQLPEVTRRLLNRRGGMAVRRAAQLFDQLHHGVPLDEIEVAQ